MRVAWFPPSLLSDWNNRSAHFTRGVVTELLARGHDVTAWEARDSASYQALVANQGPHAVSDFHAAYPHVDVRRYDPLAFDLDEALDDVDLVVVHEWNDPSLVRRIGHHRRTRRYRLLYHDTHHRTLSAPSSVPDLEDYDGVLAIGEVVRDAWLQRGVTDAWTWPEAADTRVFHPIEGLPPLGELVWMASWAGEGRTAEIREFLLDPVRSLGIRAVVHGSGWPLHAKSVLAAAGVAWGGWVPNYRVPERLARFAVTVHFPRRPYVSALPGVPSIRIYEALACGIPLVTTSISDADDLFTPGEDFLVARDGEEMRRHLRDLINDPDLAEALRERGFETILRHHTCAQRVDMLLAIARRLGVHDPAPLEPRA